MIFLSASVPDPKRNSVYFETADITAIRDAVRALATVVIPRTQLIWGGHPAITPLIRRVLKTMKANVSDHVTLYQSNFFEPSFPADNQAIENIIFTRALPTREESLAVMRREMLSVKHPFKAGIFIGGMEGVEAEFELFAGLHPHALWLPVASTGSAARRIYESLDKEKVDKRLLTEYAYMGLFKDLLSGVME